nr:hypothetical protein [Micromonospora sp. DSM 115978]
MNLRRRSAAGLLAAMLMAPGLVACGTDSDSDPGTGSSPTVAADPKQALLDSTTAIDDGNFTFTAGGDGMTGKGSIHAPSRSAQMQWTAGDEADGFSMTFDVVYIEPDTWVKTKISGLEELQAELGGTPPPADPDADKYRHLDRTRIKGIEDLEVDFQDIDPAGSAVLARSAVDVQKVDGGYTGTMDLSKATEAGMTDEDTIKALGAAATVPFTATVDGENRLTELVLQIPTVGEIEAHELKVTYAYGAAQQAQKPPASDVVEATDDVYEMFT